jgi:WXG100 family type VII secretion target
MSYTPLAVDKALLAQAPTKVDNAHHAISSQLSKMWNDLSQLLNNATFQGHFAMSYSQVQIRWNDDVTKLTGALTQIRDILQTNHSNYAAQEATQAADISKINSILNPS